MCFHSYDTGETAFVFRLGLSSADSMHFLILITDAALVILNINAKSNSLFRIK